MGRRAHCWRSELTISRRRRRFLIERPRGKEEWVVNTDLFRLNRRCIHGTF